MSDEVEELIQEIAVKHGIVLGADDPLMILPTINQRLIADFDKTLSERLATLNKELEAVSQKWGEDAKARAEKILNHALNASRDHITAAMQTGVDGLPDTIRRAVRAEISGQLAPVIKKIQMLLRLTFFATALSLITSAIALWVALQR